MRPWFHLLIGVGAVFCSARCASLAGFQLGYDAGLGLRPLPSPDSDCVLLRSNGCGPDGVLGVLIPDCPLGLACFDDFCEGHDLCYGTCGSSKSACDEQFYTNMRFLCSVRYDDGDPRRELCEGVAYIYWQIVVRFADSYYIQTQALACSCEELVVINGVEAGKPALERAFGPALDAVAPFADADDDLLPDAWELEFGCDPGDPGDALVDPDLDGLINLQEFLYGTDPFVADTDGDGRLDGEQVAAGL